MTDTQQLEFAVNLLAAAAEKYVESLDDLAQIVFRQQVNTSRAALLDLVNQLKPETPDQEVLQFEEVS